jgi:hypothetical protein
MEKGEKYILRSVFWRFWHCSTTTSFFCRGSRCEMIPGTIKRTQARGKILILSTSIRDLETMHINRESRNITSRQMLRRDSNRTGRFVDNRRKRSINDGSHLQYQPETKGDGILCNVQIQMRTGNVAEDRCTSNSASNAKVRKERIQHNDREEIGRWGEGELLHNGRRQENWHGWEEEYYTAEKKATLSGDIWLPCVVRRLFRGKLNASRRSMEEDCACV